MSEVSPQTLFRIFNDAVRNNRPRNAALVRQDIKNLLGISERIPDRVLLDTLRRRLDTTPLREVIDPHEEVRIVIDRYGEDFADIFQEYDDLFKV
jgi:hypothetical protein